MGSVIIYRALGGGVMIGGAAVLLLLLNGRIAGVSNIAGNLPFSTKGDRWWRVLFLLGLVAGAGLFYCFVSKICEPFLAREVCQVHDITRFP